MARRTPQSFPLIDPPVLRRGPIVEVAPAAPVDRLYSYVVPPELADAAAPGVRVRVPFGRRGRLIDGYVVQRGEGDWDTSLLPIESVLDERALLSPALLELANWTARYYACPLGVAISAVVPAPSRRSAGFRTVRYVLLARAPSADEKLSAKQRAVVAVFGAGTEARRHEGTEGKSEAAGRRAGSGSCPAPFDLPTSPEPEASPAAHADRPPGMLPLDLVCRRAGCTPAVIRTMVRSGLVRIVERREASEPAESSAPTHQEPDFDLNPEQYAAAERIIAAMEPATFRVFLLFGVTGSGKTEVYVHAMRHVLAAGRQAILLVPEIALTTQTVQRLSKRFERVAVIHSGLTDAQRARSWAAIAEGRIDLVIGTRSAVFAPCPRLGLIVVDEEQEGGYKNLAAPRYHTRDVAVKRGQIEGVPVVLGSATPSIETWHNAQRLPHYELLRLPRRVGGLTRPRIRIVDMRREHQERRGLHLLSREMERHLAETLERKRQAVLLLNRRGFANYLFCPRCGTPIVCPNCGVFVVYHMATQLAHCHYCNARLNIPDKCQMAGCGGTLVRFGMGTERVERELREKFPQARAARMDSDVMTRPADYAEVLSRFEARELDVLVGTQMIAKGLDYPFVSFVGVVSADTALAVHDFRSTERTFQLVLQVAGRSGRSDLGGDVVVQTFKADLPAIRHAIGQDYERFAAEELSLRKKYKLPPVTRMTRIVVADARLARARDAGTELARGLREACFAQGAAVTIVGARPCFMPRLRNQYRYEILLTFASATAMQEGLTRLRGAGLLKARAATLTVDVDPVSLQ